MAEVNCKLKKKIAQYVFQWSVLGNTWGTIMFGNTHPGSLLEESAGLKAYTFFCNSTLISFGSSVSFLLVHLFRGIHLFKGFFYVLFLLNLSLRHSSVRVNYYLQLLSLDGKRLSTKYRILCLYIKTTLLRPLEISVCLSPSGIANNSLGSFSYSDSIAVLYCQTSGYS